MSRSDNWLFDEFHGWWNEELQRWDMNKSLNVWEGTRNLLSVYKTVGLGWAYYLNDFSDLHAGFETYEIAREEGLDALWMSEDVK